MFKKDHAQLWGNSLEGPIIFVDRQTRFAVANQADLAETLTPIDGVFVGQLPANVMVSNTAIDWNNSKWTMLLWPLPEESNERNLLLAHESWHRIQDQLGFPSSGATNDHLDSLAGRYLLQLEWRALSVALRSSLADRNKAISDAIHFRFRRHELIEGSSEQERAMELHEGLAEYTGVRLALDPAQRIARTASLLDRRPAELPTFVRSFAYLSGPAYGLLLDESNPVWIGKISVKSDLGKLLSEVAKVELERDLEMAVANRATKYNSEALWVAEKIRDEKRQTRLERLTMKFLTGPRLLIPLENPRMSFDPTELTPLGDAGTVYPTLNITSEWGVLNVTGGALLSKDFGQVIVGVPDNYASSLQTADWKLELNPGWSIQSSTKPTFTVVPDPK